MQFTFINRLLTAILLIFVCAAPCLAMADDDTSDPLEQPNRYVFYFNDGLDRFIFEPISKGYHYVVPQYAQDRVHHAVVNLEEPLSTVNYWLQGNFDEGFKSFDRFVINSTFGIAGLWDMTDKQSTDKLTGFGDTFARWGIPSGPYLVLPFIGSSDFRAGVGTTADYYGDPVSWVVWSDSTEIRHPDTLLDIKDGVTLLDERTRLLKPIDDLRKNSLDFYTSARSIYMQRRAARLGNDGQPAANAPDFH